jgi:hypothetical protein
LRRPPRRSLHSIDGPRLFASSSPWGNNRTLPFDRSHPAFRKCIPVWAAQGESQTFHTLCRQGLPEFSAELGITILQNVATAVQISQLLQRRIARYLAHPVRIWMSSDSRDRPAGCPGQVTTSTVKKSVPARTSICRRLGIPLTHPTTRFGGGRTRAAQPALLGGAAGESKGHPMPTNEISPRGRLASLRYGRDAVPAQGVAHGLVGDCVPRLANAPTIRS